MDSQAFLDYGLPRTVGEARIRSSSSPSSGGLSSCISHPVSPTRHTRSYPSSPQTVSQSCSMASKSYPVFPSHAQPSLLARGATYRVREAVLHTKNPLAAETVVPVQSRPKMHLYAADKKPTRAAPNVEEFPEVPVEWLVGRSPSSSQTPSIGTSVSLSELQSGDSSEDESDSMISCSERGSSPSSLSSVPSTPIIGEDSGLACHFLSVGLKALLKVQA